MAKLCIYLIGELATYLINNTTLNCKNETLAVNENDILHLFNEVGNKHNNLGNETVIEYLLNALVKLLIKFKEKRTEIETMIKKYKRSYFSEVQSRALEYLQFNKSNKEQMKTAMIEAIPTPQKNKEDKDKSQKEKRKLVDDKDEENYEPEDDLICVRLTEGVIKNIEININENNDNNKEGLDFLGDNDNENNNNNKQGGGNLDLLDLNSIFSATGNADSAQNNNQNVQNNNPTSDPFDILNMQLNQNQNNENNNQKPNTDINDILNMVIGANNNNDNNNNINNNTNNQQIHQNQEAEINSMKECFKNEDISIYYNISKKEAGNIDGTFYATNNKNVPISDVKIIFQVQKFVKLNVLHLSGDHLEPSQSLGIKKDFALTSSEPHKKINIKIRLEYKINNEEKKEEFIIKNL